MSRKTLFNWKKPLVVLLVLVVFLVGSAMYVGKQREFRVVHNTETPSVYGPDGRAAVGNAESYDVMASGALLWKMTKEHNKIWRVLAWVFVAISVGYVFAGANDFFNFKGMNWPLYLSVAITFACWLGAYSSAFGAEQKIRLNPWQYEQVKDDPEALAKLFTSKDYIR